MNKKLFLTLLLIIFLALSFYFFFQSRNKTSVSLSLISDMEVVYGLVKEKKEDIVLLDSSLVAQTGLPTEEKVEKIEPYKIDKNTIFYRFTNDIKSEAEFREEEKQYNFWLQQNKDKMTIDRYKEAPTWQKTEEINFSDLNPSDQVKVFYYQDGEGTKKAFKIVVAFKSASEEDVYSQIDQELEFKGQIKTVGADKILLADNTYLPDQEITLFTDSETVFIKKSKKTEEQFRKEEDSFRDKLLSIREEGGDTSALKAPSWFFEEKASITDLSAGLEIKIKAIKNQDFTAKLIEFVYQ